MSRPSVMVIGAGVAGLEAAITLAESGCEVTLLESSNRVGGRICTRHVGNASVELGAEFVHGRPPELMQLLKMLELDTMELDGVDLSYTREGGLHPEKEAADSSDGSNPFSLLEELETWANENSGRDLSFADYLKERRIAPEFAAAAIDYVEGFNAADANAISVQALALQQKAEDAVGGDAVLHVKAGYDTLARRMTDRFLRAGGTLNLETHVEELRWQPGRVTARLAAGGEVEAGRSVIALPLGVLQSRSVRFDPEPGTALFHAERMRVGQVCRISLVFRRRWWAKIRDPKFAQAERLSFLFAHERERSKEPHFRVFWTSFPSTDPVITAWSGGPSSEAFENLDEQAIAQIACSDLARIFGLALETVLSELTSHYMHDWRRDPLAKGAYSWVPVGSVDAPERMAQPVENTLFFAGEHTDVTGHWGTVHGALRSGMRAARQILDLSGK